MIDAVRRWMDGWMDGRMAYDPHISNYGFHISPTALGQIRIRAGRSGAEQSGAEPRTRH